MEEQKGIGLTILGVVAIIAIVGLILLLTNAGVTGELSGGQKWGAKRYVPQSINAIASECDTTKGVTILGENERGCKLVACNENKLQGRFNPKDIHTIC